MIDIDPPQHAATTWRDFFIHIGTIVLGILIAIGLEQSVEYFHHRHQLREDRAELSAEYEENQGILRKNLAAVETIQSQLDHNMALLREHQSSHAPLPEKLNYSWNLYRTPDAVWQSVRQDGALSLMPRDELRRNVYFYEVLTSFMDAVHEFYTQAEIAGAIARRSPDGSLSPHDTEELITATSEAQARLAYAAKFLSYETTALRRAGY